MINVSVQTDEGIIIVEPSGPLENSDFEKLAKEIDAFSENKGRLVGLIIHTKSFPGWDDFGSFVQHMKFVKEHHKLIRRVAIVTDSKLGEVGPVLANLFVSAQVKHFPFDKLVKAKEWAQDAV